MVVFLADLLLYFQASKILSNQVEQQLFQHAWNNKQRSEQAITTTIETLEMLAQQPAMNSILDRDADHEISRLLDSVLEDTDKFDLISCTTPQGDLIAFSGPILDAEHVEVTDQQIDRLEQGQRALVEQGPGLAYVTVPIYREFDEREMLGVLRVSVKYSAWLPDTRGFWTGLVDSDGTSLYQLGARLPSKLEPGVREIEMPDLGRLIFMGMELAWPREVSGPPWRKSSHSTSRSTLG